MALTTFSLSILTTFAWFFLIVCIGEFICELFGYGLAIKLIEELETNPDYGPKNKELAEEREKSTGAKMRAKRKANYDTANAQNTSKNLQLEPLNH